MMTIDARDASLFASFLKRLAPSTRRAYSANLLIFAKSAVGPEQSGAASAAAAVHILRACSAQLADALVEQYSAQLRRTGKSDATIAQHLSSVKALADFLRGERVIQWNLRVALPRREAYRDTRGTGTDGALRILAAIDAEEDGPKARRGRTMVLLMFVLALKRGELRALQFRDLNLGACTLGVTGRKGRRVHVMPPWICDAMHRWINVRGSEPGPLFIRLDCAAEQAGEPAPLSGKAIWELVREYGSAAGVRAWPQGLRHAGITELLDRTGGDIRAAREFAGHADANATFRFDDNLRAERAKGRPRGRAVA
jgi:integrase/recombinase XerC